MIKEGGIICVTGSARTGTSMMMQTLINLGYKTPALKFTKEHKRIEDKNPKGFYELAEEVINGVHHDNYKGQAVKLFPGCLWKTEKEFISKIIICKRNKVDATKSYTPIHKIMEEPYTPSEIYDVNYEIINEYIDNIPHIFINFEDIIRNPRHEITKLVVFLGLWNVSDEKLDKAIKNIDLWQ